MATVKEDTKRFYHTIASEATEIMQCINHDMIPDDEELAYYWEDEQFDIINWLNAECLEADSHDLLLATGGPVCGVSLVRGAPVFWFQDWFTPKECKQLEGLAFDFYLMIFETLKELD